MVGDGTYISQTGGGSLTAGVLFGALGAIANQASIAAESERVRKSVDAESVVRIVPAAQLAQAWEESALPESTDPKAVKVEPFVVFHLDNDRTNVHVVPGLRASGSDLVVANNKAPWTGHYLLPLERTLAPQKLHEPLDAAELEEQRAAVRDAYAELLRELAKDLAGGVQVRKLASIKSAALKATTIGFAGFTPGDIEQAPDGRLSIRVNVDNYGPAMTRANPYFVFVFRSPKQYTFSLGPEDRTPARMNRPGF